MERRQYPRVHADLAAVITISDGTKINVVVCDTSSTGLRVQCRSRDRELITPHGNCIERGNPIQIDIEITLCLGSGQKTTQLNARCELVFSRRIAEYEYEIGMSYNDIDGETYAQLSEFIAARLKQNLSESP